MEVMKRFNWLKISDFALSNPIECQAFDCMEEKGERGMDISFVFVCELPKGHKVTRKITLYGDNLDKCIDSWGTNSEKWNGKKFKIHRVNSIEGKSINVLEIIK